MQGNAVLYVGLLWGADGRDTDLWVFCGDARRPGEAMNEPVIDRPVTPMALLLGDLPGLEQMELDAPGDGRDAGLAWFAGGEVAGFLVLRGLARSGRSRT